MNTVSNAMHESSAPVKVLAPVEIPWTRRFYWLLRRELWENRSIYVAPLAIAAVFLLGFLVRVGGLPARMRSAAALEPMKQYAALAQPYDMVAALVMITVILVAVFYSLDALYGERRDRSSLFWKSLPVSDTTTVLAKASIPLLIMPLLGVLVTALAQFLMLLVSSAALAAAGQSPGTLWREVSLGRSSLLLLYHMFAVHVLWHAPLYAWLLLVSAWARRAPFLWAFLPPVAIWHLEQIVFNTSHVLGYLKYRLEGNGMDALLMPGTMPMDPMTQATPGRFLTSAGLWGGLVVAALFLAAAVRLRRYRGPI